MLSEIARSVPLWVPPLFVILLVLGLKARNRREVPVVLIYLIPLLSVLSLRTLISVPIEVLGWVIFMIALAIGLWLGLRLQTGYLIARKGARVEVAGEWVTLGLLMSVFLGNFLTGVLIEVAPDVLNFVPLQIGLCLLLGCVSGIFLGRAVCVWRAPHVM